MNIMHDTIVFWGGGGRINVLLEMKTWEGKEQKNCIENGVKCLGYLIIYLLCLVYQDDSDDENSTINNLLGTPQVNRGIYFPGA